MMALIDLEDAQAALLLDLKRLKNAAS